SVVVDPFSEEEGFEQHEREACQKRLRRDVPERGGAAHAHGRVLARHRRMERRHDAPVWHFRFYGHTPELLVKGRERTYFEHFWNDFAADPKHSIPETDRRAYAKAYARPGRMTAGFAYFKSFLKTADDFAELGKTRLAMPVASIGGEKANGDALGAQVKLISTNP